MSAELAPDQPLSIAPVTVVFEEIGHAARLGTTAFTNAVTSGVTIAKIGVQASLGSLGQRVLALDLWEAVGVDGNSTIGAHVEALGAPGVSGSNQQLLSHRPSIPPSVPAEAMQEFADRRREVAATHLAGNLGPDGDTRLSDPVRRGWSMVANITDALRGLIVTAEAYSTLREFEWPSPIAREGGLLAADGLNSLLSVGMPPPPMPALPQRRPEAESHLFLADVSNRRVGVLGDEAAPASNMPVQERLPDAGHWPRVKDAQSQPTMPYSSRRTSSTDRVVSIGQGASDIDGGSLVGLLEDRLARSEERVLNVSLSREIKGVQTDNFQDVGLPVVAGRAHSALAVLPLSAQLANGTTVGAGSDAASSGSRSVASLDVSASAGFDSNPFLSERQNPEVASLRLQLAPRLEQSDGRSTLRAVGRLEHVEYLGRYRAIQNYGADVSGVHRLSERVEISAGTLLRSDILASDLTSPVLGSGSIDPNLPTIPGGNDVTVLGQAQRRNQFGANAGLRWTPSTRDELRFSSNFRADRFGDGNLSDSNFYAQQLRYSRQLSDSLSIGTVVDAGIIDFAGPAFGDTRTISPQALVVAKLGDRLTASASFGVAVSRVELQGGNQTDTAFAGNLSLCRQGQRSSLCATGSRQVLPSAIGGARLQTTGGLSYSLRVSERDSFQLGGSYATASEPLAGVGGNFESINAFASYERRLNERMRLQARTGYIDTSGQGGLDASNFQALVGISITLGRRQ